MSIRLAVLSLSINSEFLTILLVEAVRVSMSSLEMTLSPSLNLCI